MEINYINERNIIISFPEFETNIFIIYGEKYTYICDTFLGPESMNKVKDMIIKDKREQPIIVFNSHRDWDHVWGNCAFENSTIIAHYKCREYLEKHFLEDLEKKSHFAKGKVLPCYPNLLFTDRILFPDDDIEFFYTPGHTEDSSSCYDRKTKTLFVGDNVEPLIPIIQNKDLKSYINTLKKYIDIQPEVIITGHGKDGTMNLLNSNLNYLEKLDSGEDIGNLVTDEKIIKIHKTNISRLL